MKKAFVIAMVLLMSLSLAFAGASSEKATTNDIECGIMNWQEPSDLEIFPHPAIGEWKQYTSLTSMILDLNAGNVEYLLVPTSVANYLKAQDDSLTVAPGGKGVPTEIRMAVRKDDSELFGILEQGITTLRDNGTLEKLVDEYIASISVSDDGIETAKTGKTYVVGVTGDLPPMDYVASDGNPSGFNVALMNEIAKTQGVSFTFVQVDAEARLVALTSKRIDVIFWYGNVEGYTSQREELLVTSSYYKDGISYVTKSFDMKRIQEAMDNTDK